MDINTIQEKIFSKRSEAILKNQLRILADRLTNTDSDNISDIEDQRNQIVEELEEVENLQQQLAEAEDDLNNYKQRLQDIQNDISDCNRDIPLEGVQGRP